MITAGRNAAEIEYAVMLALENETVLAASSTTREYERLQQREREERR